MTGDSQVSQLQEFLTAEGHYSGPITGNFFSLTLAGVKTFQTANEISPVSGYFGPLSRAKANSILSEITDEAGEIFETPTTTDSVTNDDVVASIQEMIASLLSQIALLQSQLTATQELTEQVEQQNQVIQQQGETLNQIASATQEIADNTTTTEEVAETTSIIQTTGTVVYAGIYNDMGKTYQKYLITGEDFEIQESNVVVNTSCDPITSGIPSAIKGSSVDIGTEYMFGKMNIPADSTLLMDINCYRPTKLIFKGANSGNIIQIEP